MSLPVSEMACAEVLAYKLSRWDYQLLRTHGIPLADHDMARDSYHKLSKLTKADTKAAVEATYVSQKRQLLTKLQELRAAAGQAMKKDLRIASAAVTAAKDAAEKGPSRHGIGLVGIGQPSEFVMGLLVICHRATG